MKLDLQKVKRKPLRKKSLALLKKMFNQSGMDESSALSAQKSSKSLSKKVNPKGEFADLKSMRSSLWQFLGRKKKSKTELENSLP